MTNLLWPGDHRAGDMMSDAALLQAMVAVEAAWLTALSEAGVAPGECVGVDLRRLVRPEDAATLAASAEAGGSPVIGVVGLLRARAGGQAAQWIHRGLTSQDVLDTALMLALRGVASRIRTELAQQLTTLCDLAEQHRDTPMVARTLTQHALPITFGAKAANWLDGVAEAYQRLIALTTPIQIGGAAGTLAAATELAILVGTPADVAQQLVQKSAIALGLTSRRPWHTTRAPVSGAADTLVCCTDAWGRIAADVVTLSRPEIGELTEPSGDGRGRSSTLPGKRNPVLAILIRRAALAAPPLAATLHTAAVLANDERPDGAWHAEWDTLRILARRTVVAASQCTELLRGLAVHTEQMAHNLARADVPGEQQAIADLVGTQPSATYFGSIGVLIDQSARRARQLLDDTRTDD